MTLRTQLYIDGAWRDGEGGSTFAVDDPATGTEIARFAVASEGDCLAAVGAAASAQPAWAATAPRARAERLLSAFAILRAEREQLAALITRENGKASADALAEADYATEFFRWFAEEAVRIGGDYRLSPDGRTRIVVAHHPIGVSLLITPWNFPAAMATRKLAPALAAGCAVVLKPAAETPLTAAYLVDVLARAGVPHGVVNLVTPLNPGPAVRGMLGHPAMRKLSFTGSTEVGRLLLREAAGTVLSTSMELGGNAALLVLPGADVAAAVEGAIVAKMRNGGSACTAANRMYVHDSLHDEFVDRLVQRLGEFTVGPGSDPANTLGSLVSTKERDKVARLVDGAVAEGAKLRLGGAPLKHGAFYPATLVTGVEHGSTINQTEIFGPVSAITRFSDVDDAVRMANDTIFGLVSYVFGPEHDAMRVALRLDCGMVGINRGTVSDPAAPFGGTRQSGLGREGGEHGIFEYLETQYLGVAP